MEDTFFSRSSPHSELCSDIKAHIPPIKTLRVFTVYHDLFFFVLHRQPCRLHAISAESPLLDAFFPLIPQSLMDTHRRQGLSLSHRTCNVFVRRRRTQITRVDQTCVTWTHIHGYHPYALAVPYRVDNIIVSFLVFRFSVANVMNTFLDYYNYNRRRGVFRSDSLCSSMLKNCPLFISYHNLAGSPFQWRMNTHLSHIPLL